MTSTSAEQTEAIRQSMQDEKRAFLKLVSALQEARACLVSHTGGEDGACAFTIQRIDLALRKAGAL